MAKQYSLDQYRYISNSKKMRKALDIPKYALHNLQSCSLAVLQSCSLAVLQSCSLAVLQSCSLAVSV